MKKIIVLTIALFSVLTSYSQEMYTTTKNGKPFVATYSLSEGRTKMTINDNIYDFREDKNSPINQLSGWIFRRSTKQLTNGKATGTWYRIVIRFQTAAEVVIISKEGKVIEKFDNED